MVLDKSGNHLEFRIEALVPKLLAESDVRVEVVDKVRDRLKLFESVQINLAYTRVTF